MKPNDKIYVAGHKGLVGSALIRALQAKGYDNIITRTHSQLELMDKAAVDAFFNQTKPDYVFLAAAKVGGIWANDNYPADFIYQNLLIQNNIINASKENQVQRLLFLGSSCIYPRNCPQPIKEDYLLTGTLEATNRPYALAKIAGIELCWAFNRQFGTKYLAVMPTNLYGPGDNYDLKTSHVIPALIRKMHEAKENNAKQVVVWGTGTPKREFLYSDDLADACLFLMNLDDQKFNNLISSKESAPIVNIGCGEDLTISELAHTIAKVVGFEGEIVFDSTKPDGTPRKVLSVDKIHSLGWEARTSLFEGVHRAFLSFMNQDCITLV
ncbi:MAG: GDP-L-fucose synthase family protein [Candidatus Berkiella sp.]